MKRDREERGRVTHVVEELSELGEGTLDPSKLGRARLDLAKRSSGGVGSLTVQKL